MQLSIREVARGLGVSEDAVYGWVREGDLRAHRAAGRYRVNRADLIEWAHARGMPLAADVLPEATDADVRLPALADSLLAGGIFRGLDATDKTAALRAVVGAMKLDPDVDRELLLQVLLARESMASTGVGDGIAIPHVRNPIVLSAHSPAISLCFLQRPVEFGAMDGRPVHTLFTVISPTVRAHLYMLSRLAFALRAPAFRDAIRRRATEPEILAAAREAEQTMTSPVPGGPEGGPG